jgi:hypothetical protein
LLIETEKSSGVCGHAEVNDGEEDIEDIVQ